METRKILILAAVVLVALTGVYFMTQSSPSKTSNMKLKIGYQPSTHQVAEMVAREKGWWLENLKEFGVTEVSDSEFSSGPPEMTAMMAGELDIAYVGATPPIPAIDKDLEAKIVAGVQIQGSALALRSGLEYEGPENLKGLTVATFPPGSIQDTILRKWLDNHGISYGAGSGKNPVEISPMGAGDAVQAIQAGKVDGVFLPHPHPATVELENAAKIVENSGDIWENHACCCLLVSQDLIQNRPKMVDEIIGIHINATEWAQDHPMETAKIYSQKTGFSENAAEYSLKVWDGRWVHSPYHGLDSTLEYAEYLHEIEKTEKLLVQEDLFNTTFYDDVMEE